jgi:hypothetical protein
MQSTFWSITPEAGTMEAAERRDSRAERLQRV